MEAQTQVSGQDITRAREKLGLTLGMACHRFACGVSILSRIESNRMEPGDETLKETMVAHYRKQGVLES